MFRVHLKSLYKNAGRENDMKKLKKIVCLVMVFALLMSGVTSVAAASPQNPLDQWHLRKSEPLDDVTGLFGAAYGNGTFMVTKGHGNFYTSSDGEAWADININNILKYIDVEYGNDSFVAVGDYGVIAKTTDAGISWTPCFSPNPNTLRGIAYDFNKNIFMAVGDGNTVLTSSNGGDTWSNSANPVPISGPYSVAYGNNSFVVIGSGGVATTTDGGGSWTVGSGDTSSLSEVVYGNGIFVAVGAVGVVGKVLTSTDGSVWTSQLLPPISGLYSVTYGNNYFAAVGANGTIITSPNGVDWTDRNTTKTIINKNLYNVTCGKNTFVAVGAFGNVVQSDILSGDISGTVTNGGQPLSDVIIVLNEGGITPSAITANDGTYSFAGIIGGTGYTITASKTGYNTITVSNVNVVPGATTTPSIDLSMTVLGAQSATASVASSTPTAGSDNPVTLTIKDGLGNTDTGFNGSKIVTISGTTATQNGTYGSFNGTTLAAGTQSVSVDFTNGVAVPSLKLNNAAAQNVSFSIAGVAASATGSISITPTSGDKAALRIINNVTAPASNGGAFVTQPVIEIIDEFGNTCTGDSSTQLTVSKKDAGAWTLTGTTNRTAVNGIVTFSGLGATNTAQVINAQLALNSVGMTEITSAVVTLPAPAPTVVSSSSGSTQPVTPIKITISYALGKATATLTVDAINDSTGKSVVAVTEQQLKDAVNKALEEAVKLGNKAAPVVELKINAPAGAKEIQTSLPEGALSTLAQSNIVELKISTPLGVMTFDKKFLQTMAEGTADGVKVTVAKVAPETLSGEAKQKVGNRPVYSFTVTNPIGDKTISDFGGSVTVSVAYTPQTGEDTNAIVIYYLNQKGELEIVSNGVYDSATGTISFTTNHFSIYAVGYNKVSFRDVEENDWYKNAVEFIAARDITTGVGNGKYNPDSKLSRGEFLVMLMKAYGIAPDATSKNNFLDAGSNYYTGYMAAAKRLEITGGVGDNMFAPNKQITRQEMVTLLYNALKVINKLPEANQDKQLAAYSDADKIDFWAKDAMTLFVQAEIISGNKNKLYATTTTTRAEMAQVLYKLIARQK